MIIKIRITLITEIARAVGCILWLMEFSFEISTKPQRDRILQNISQQG